MKIEGWEIRPIARLYYKETEMYDAQNEMTTMVGWETIGKVIIPTQSIIEMGNGDYAAGKALLDRILMRMSDEPSPPKPFGEAVADSWRGIKDWYNGPETSQKTDPSVREHVNAEVDRQIKASEKQKPFPGILP